MTLKNLYKILLCNEIVLGAIIFFQTIFMSLYAFGFYPINPNSSFGPEASLIFAALYALPIALIYNIIILVFLNSKYFINNKIKKILKPLIGFLLLSLVFSCLIMHGTFSNPATYNPQLLNFGQWLVQEILTFFIFAGIFGLILSTLYFVIFILYNQFKTKQTKRYYRFVLPFLCYLLLICLVGNFFFENSLSSFFSFAGLAIASLSLFSILPVAVLELIAEIKSGKIPKSLA
jgi:hypothetical protein